MITIDGSYGEGGGQILRTSLALSLVTGKPFCINKIRAGRKKPGLMRQHLTALIAAAEIGNATISGNRTGSQTFTFEPKTIKAGSYHFTIGSAGSCTLVFQTILPALMIADKPSEIVLEGGTHNPFAPPFDFLQNAFLPIINTMGPLISAILDRPGFYPAGGGKFRVSVQPTDRLKKIYLTERGEIVNHKACAMVSNLSPNIAKRELKVVQEKLRLNKDCLVVLDVQNAQGPGNILTIEVESQLITEVFTGFGEQGVPAEKVAKKTIKQAREYLVSDAVVGQYLADQLLVPMAMSGGGKFKTMAPTPHTTTNMEIIKKFLDVEITMTEHGKRIYNVEIHSN